jgi:hypothetical protein
MYVVNSEEVLGIDKTIDGGKYSVFTGSLTPCLGIQSATTVTASHALLIQSSLVRSLPCSET